MRSSRGAVAKSLGVSIVMSALVVQTTCGAVRGMERDGVAVWRGVPYAEPPVGALRCLPPMPPHAWTGERDATKFGAVAMQSRDPRIATMSGVTDKVAMGEDCLVLNVFAPLAYGDGTRRPVMVWIHGGAFVMGSGSTPLYHGDAFVRDDVVVVTLNYRLGVLGFLYLGHRSEAHRAGNIALLDQIAALTWVRDNNAAFGGDPGNVTVMGESAGAVSIATLLAMPGARGLFHAAILESGASQLIVPTRDDAIAAADAVLSEIGVGEHLEGLAEVPVDRIMEAQVRMTAERGLAAFAPFVDGVSVPRPPIDAARDGSAIAVPMLLG
jgi:para-nitrobenzyl esterase